MQLQVGIGLDEVIEKVKSLIERSKPLYLIEGGIKRQVLDVKSEFGSGIIFDANYYYIDVETIIAGKDYFKTRQTERVAVNRQLIDAIHDVKNYKAKFVFKLAGVCSQVLEITDLGEQVLQKI